MPDEQTEDAGFWLRTGTCIFNSILLSLILMPLLLVIYGAGYFIHDSFFTGAADTFIQQVLPTCLTVFLWYRFGATPGNKMSPKLKVLNTRNSITASITLCSGRNLDYFFSVFPLELGGGVLTFDRRKQGWNDKLAGAVIVRDNHQEPVTFNQDS